MGLGGVLEDWRRDPSRTLRLEQDYARSLPFSLRPYGHWLSHAREFGELKVGLWTVPGSPSVALVSWKAFPGMGTRVSHLFVDSPTPSPTLLSDILAVLSEREGPVFALTDLLAGLSPEEVRPLLQEMGYVHFEHVDTVFPSGKPLPPVPTTGHWSFRSIAPSDEAVLVEISCRAYAGYEEQLMWPTLDLRRDLMDYVRDSLSGGEEKLILGASLLAFAGEVPVGYILSCLPSNGNPYVASVQVDPAFQGQGVGRALLLQVLSELRALYPAQDVGLTYVRQNVRGRALYESVGFEPLPAEQRRTAGSWLSRKALASLPQSSVKPGWGENGE